MSDELIYQIALTQVPHIGDVHSKALVNHFGSASAVFKASKKELDFIDGIGSIRATSLKGFNNFKEAEKEIAFIEKFKISPLFITSENYPKRLLNCYDSPSLLYYKGNADLNTSKIVAVVGTRSHNDYGKMICEKLINDLIDEDILIVSGLAYGIDSIAHKCAVKSNLKTVGVLAHGLDNVYPAQNKILAREMVKNGGLLTEFKSNTKPDKQNFPTRNRIVAGMSDCIVVIETGIKGGSLITAELANGYNKDVFAFPGKVSDQKSEGCNYLIKNNKAALITSADDLLENMGWKKKVNPVARKQRALFIELAPEEKIIIGLFDSNDTLHIDELYLKSKLSSSAVAQALLMLEMQGIIASLPGKTYKMLD